MVIVTSDSISMTSEACYTGKPVYVFELPVKSSRFHKFYRSLYENDHARPFCGTIEPWKAIQLDEKSRVIPIVKERLSLAIK